MQRVLAALSADAVEVTDVRTRHATLEDVFVRLTTREEVAADEEV